jgi:alkylation response protein AidB-like acyl-CoA dehydrogenase
LLFGTAFPKLKAGAEDGAWMRTEQNMQSAETVAMRRERNEQPAENASAAFYLQRVDALAREIDAAGQSIDAERDIPAALLKRFDAEGFWRLLLPPSLGGAALALPDFVLTIEALAKLNASVAWVVGQTAGCSMVAAYMDPQAAARVFQSEPRGVLAWGPGPDARAVAAPGGYRLTGNFSLASGSHVATWLGALCPIYEADGNPRLDANKRPEMRHFLFPREAAPLRDDWRVIGLRGTGSDGYELKDLFVPDELVVARSDPKECRCDLPLYRVASPVFYACSFGFLALGVARGMMDAFVALASKKTPRGDASSLAANPLTQHDVGLLEARLRAARSFLWESVEAAWAEIEQTGTLPIDQRMTVRMAGTFAFAESATIVDGLYHAAGSTAMFEDHPFERRLRDIHSIQQQLHGRKAHFQTVGCYLMGGTPNTAFL